MRLIASKRSALIFASIVAVLSVAACGNSGFSPSGNELNSDLAVKRDPTPAPMNEELSICSTLSLKDIVWPEALDFTGKRAMAIGLNLSGSFEGSSGWKNITNNFDGQGLSLGLLNQCLGQGSLQPLLVKMRDRNNAELREPFSVAHQTSLLGMLTKWQGVAKATSLDSALASGADGEGDEGLRTDGRLSDLDSLPDGSDGVGQQESASSDSVTWAKQTLYTDGGTTFQSVWKKELQTLSTHPAYVSIQIEAALTLHTKALAYMKSLGLHQLRSYLFLFDVNVQNGGLYAADVTAYKAAFPSGSSASTSADETTRLKKMLELRLTHVIAKYKSDVSARKLSIINGAGVVHGDSRNYPKQYCFTGTDKIL